MNRRTIGVVVGCALLAILATFPVVLDPLGRLLGHPDVDATNHAWGPWWWWHTLGRGVLPWRTDLLAAPTGGVLWFIDPVSAAVGAPLVGLAGAVGAYNVAQMVNVGVAAAGGWALARTLGAGRDAAWIGAVGVALGPYLLCELHNGVSEAASVGPATLTLAAARHALATPARTRPWLWTGLGLGLTAAGTWSYGLTTGLTIGAWAAVEAVRRRGWRGMADPAVRGAAVTAVVAGVVAAPALYALWSSVHAPEALVQRGDVDAATAEFLLRHNAVDPRAWVAPLGFQSVDLAAHGEAFLHSSYLGLAALGLVAFLVAVQRDRAWVIVGVLPAAALSLGAFLWWGDDWVTLPDGRRIGLPFLALRELLPGAGSTHAQRLGWPVVAVVAALAASGAEVLAAGRRLRLAALGAIVALDALCAAPWPVARLDAVDDAAHLEALRRTRVDAAAGTLRGTVVLDLPAEAGDTMATSVYLLHQAATGLPIPYRPDARGGTSTLVGRPAFAALLLPSTSRGAHAAAMRAALGDDAEVDLGAIESEAQVRWIVLHTELERGRGDIARLEAQLTAWFGTPDRFGVHALYDVRARVSDRGRVLDLGPATP